MTSRELPISFSHEELYFKERPHWGPSEGNESGDVGGQKEREELMESGACCWGTLPCVLVAMGFSILRISKKKEEALTKNPVCSTTHPIPTTTNADLTMQPSKLNDCAFT